LSQKGFQIKGNLLEIKGGCWSLLFTNTSTKKIVHNGTTLFFNIVQ